MSGEAGWNEGSLLDVFGNETRRRILRLLADEPRYFNQLSRDVRVSQQAVLKHLELLEEAGLVNSYRARSDLAGPDRKYYRLNGSLQLTIGMTGDTFRIKVKDLASQEGSTEGSREFKRDLRSVESGTDISKMVSASRDLIGKIERDVAELDEKRANLLKLRQKVMSKVHDAIRGSFEESLARRILYSRLDSVQPMDIENLSEELDAREKEVRHHLAELEKRLQFSLSS